MGWQVEVVDWKLSPQMDLLNPEVRKRHMKEQKQTTASVIAIPCNTLTRIREKPIPGHPNAPKPLRDKEHPRGLNSLSPKEKAQLDEGNQLIDFGLDYAEEAGGDGNLVLLENPYNSWLKEFPKMKELKDKGWIFRKYKACNFYAAREKTQLVVGNFEELTLIEDLACHHIHTQGAWKPYQDPKTHKWVYPSEEEAEYTAWLAFTFAALLTMAAVRLGKATLKVPKLPQCACYGSRLGWEAYHPQVLRSWMMKPLALSLGLSPPRREQLEWLPPGDVAGIATSVGQASTANLERDDIYIGQGSKAVRLTKSELATPFQVGKHGTAMECMIKYAIWFSGQPQLWSRLSELKGKRLLCDCQLGKPCHRLVLAAWADDSEHGLWRRTPLMRTKGEKKLVQLVASTLVTMAGAEQQAQLRGSLYDMPQHLRFPQHAIHKAVFSLFPAEWVQNLKFPCVEDLVNSAPFTSFQEYLERCGLDGQTDTGPMWASELPKGPKWAATGDQKGAFFSKEAVEQLVPLGLDFEQHFMEAQECWKGKPFPMDSPPVIDWDLRFAANEMASNLGKLREKRCCWYGAVKELSKRMEPLSEQLKKSQSGPAKRVAFGVHVAFMAIAIILMGWPDTTLPMVYMKGTKVIGVIQKSGLFQPVETLEPIESKQDLLASSLALIDEIEARKPKHEEAVCIFEACTKDQKKGFADVIRSRQGMDMRWGVGGWAPIPTFDIVQASGRHRRIDNGKKSRHNLHTARSEGLDLCNAFQPVTNVKVFVEEPEKEGIELEVVAEQEMETGSEDSPDAHRWTPADE